MRITLILLCVLAIANLTACDKHYKAKPNPQVVLSQEEQEWVRNCVIHTEVMASFAVADCVERVLDLRTIR